KETMQRRDLELTRKHERRRGEPLALFVRAREQAAPGHGRERDGAQELGVILETVPVVRIRPSPVEYVLTVRMRFQIKRHGAGKRVAFPEQQKVRRPTGILRRASGLVER